MDAENQAKYELSGINRPIEMDEAGASKRQLAPYELDSTMQPAEIGSNFGNQGQHVKGAGSMQKADARTSIIREAESPSTQSVPETRSSRASTASTVRSPSTSHAPETRGVRASSIPDTNSRTGT